MIKATVRSSELLVEAPNIDGVTGYPFETPAMRKKLVGSVKEAVDTCGTLALIDADIDNLKQINHLIGHAVANYAIKQTVQLKEQMLAQVDYVKDVWVYRPQAVPVGGVFLWGKC